MAGKQRINLNPSFDDLSRYGELLAYFNEPWRAEYKEIWLGLRGLGRKHYEATLRKDIAAARKASWQDRHPWGEV